MRHWFITGTSSGLGRALAEAALGRGDRVTGTVLDPRDCEAFEALAHGRAKAVVLDVTDAAACERAIDAASSIDILVNNAGYSLEGVLEACSMDEIQRLLAVHLMAPIALMKAVLPGMRARRSGHIFNIASQAAHMPTPGISIYAAAKAAVETLSRAVAQEVAPFGIKVTVLVPGAFRTALGAARQSAGVRIDDYADSDEARRAFLASFTGMQRGDPAKAAAAVIRLLDFDSPPSVFAIGPDAFAGLRDHAERLMLDANQWETCGRATDFG